MFHFYTSKLDGDKFLFPQMFQRAWESMCTQCAEMILNKIEKTFNKTYIELKGFLQRFQIYFLKILGVRAWNPPAR